jgi:hypothetical protein
VQVVDGRAEKPAATGALVRAHLPARFRHPLPDLRQPPLADVAHGPALRLADDHVAFRGDVEGEGPGEAPEPAGIPREVVLDARIEGLEVEAFEPRQPRLGPCEADEVGGRARFRRRPRALGIVGEDAAAVERLEEERHPELLEPRGKLLEARRVALIDDRVGAHLPGMAPRSDEVSESAQRILERRARAAAPGHDFRAHRVDRHGDRIEEAEELGRKPRRHEVGVRVERGAEAEPARMAGDREEILAEEGFVAAEAYPAGAERVGVLEERLVLGGAELPLPLGSRRLPGIAVGAARVAAVRELDDHEVGARRVAVALRISEDRLQEPQEADGGAAAGHLALVSRPPPPGAPGGNGIRFRTSE